MAWVAMITFCCFFKSSFLIVTTEFIRVVKSFIVKAPGLRKEVGLLENV